MMEKQRDNKADVRWLQRFSNYRKALSKSGLAVEKLSINKGIIL